ncbi:MAG TPA: ROK family protein [Acidimicrobiales bacterium]|nr:ROK family protein [Acidimicrobiales bacterium]
MTTDASVYVGVDVGGTKVLALALGSSGDDVRGDARVPTPDTADGLLDAIVGTATQAATEAGALVAGVAVGVPGLVDANGVMRFAANLPGLVELPLRQTLSARLGVPVVIDNDANVAAWGERCVGAGAGADDMLMVTIGTGIGGGIVLGGELYRGAHGMAGEIGHTVVQLDGEPCHCGQRGCWERYASGSALNRLARDAGFDSSEMVVARAGENDESALEVMQTFTRWMAIGLAGLVNTLDPSVVVLGGGLVEAGDLLLNPLREWLAKLIEGGEHRPRVPLLPATLGERAGAIGAALLARASV